jgi:pimeloyl-ACP methyl ester carboxylesterase
MPSVDISGVSLYYEDIGSGKPLVLVHGIPTDFRVWNMQRDALSDHDNFRFLPISRRLAYPNKNSPPSNVKESTVQNNAEDLFTLIKKLELEQVNLIGHSFGGFVSLYCAWKHPEFFNSLVLIEPAIPSMLVENENDRFQVLSFLLSRPSAALSARRFQNGKLKQCLEAYEIGDLEKAVRFFYDGIREEEGAFERLPENIRTMMAQNGLTIAELGLEFPVFTKENAKDIKLPVLLIKGEKSPQWLRAIVDSLGKSIATSSIVEIEGSGHLPHLESPTNFNNALFGFLEKIR